jgi:hypothetical protein
VENRLSCLEGLQDQSDAVPHRLRRGVENPRLDREFWEYEMPEQANIHQITTAGFPHPSLRREGTRRRRRDTLFNCQSSDGIQEILFRLAKEVDSEQADSLISSSENAFRHFFFSPGVRRASLFRVAPFGRKSVAQYRAKIDSNTLAARPTSLPPLCIRRLGAQQQGRERLGGKGREAPAYCKLACVVRILTLALDYFPPELFLEILEAVLANPVVLVLSGISFV